MANSIEVKGTLSSTAPKFDFPFDFHVPVAPINETTDVTSGVKLNVTVDQSIITVHITGLGFITVRKTISEVGSHPFHVAVGSIVCQGVIILS